MRPWAGLALAAWMVVLPAALPGQTPAASADQRFKAIYAEEWAWRQRQYPGLEDSDQAANPQDDRFPAVDAASQSARLDHWNDVLRHLQELPADALSPAERFNLKVYRPQIENLAARIRFREYQLPLNSDSQFWSDLLFMGQRPLLNLDHARTYIARLNDLPRYFDEQIGNLRAGLKEGRSVPRVVLEGRDRSIASVVEATSPEACDFYLPFRKLPANLTPEQQAELRAACAKAIRERVRPAYARLLTFFREEYLPKARTTLAAEALPDGKAYYRQKIREYTSLDLDPDGLHQLGLREVARIDQEMKATMAAAGFHGNLQAFLAVLRADPRFQAKTPEELLMRASWICKQVDGQLGRFFGVLPRGRFGVEPAPAAVAPFWTGGRGAAGIYWLNTYDLPSRQLYSLAALTLHESAPGHAFQGALLEERQDLPEFRHEYIDAYGEGWALYCEKLGREMGIYRTPYDDFGRLSYEMWRAARLVIDTGIHHLGWSRKQANEYLAEHTALSPHEVETEVDRYISWPAQCLSYKVGELKLLELRARAEKELGPRFDLRGFHDAVLGCGPVPMGVLEEVVDGFIATRKAAKQDGGGAPGTPD